MFFGPVADSDLANMVAIMQGAAAAPPTPSPVDEPVLVVTAVAITSEGKRKISDEALDKINARLKRSTLKLEPLRAPPMEIFKRTTDYAITGLYAGHGLPPGAHSALFGIESAAASLPVAFHDSPEKDH
jgi:hypothetical protein